MARPQLRRRWTEGAPPNILILWGDDIGWFNVSAYNHGIMGYRTPNIDRIGREGAIFTDWYGQNSCTAGRAAFITGQSPIRTGLTKVGLPGADLGLQPEDPTIAELLKPLGYVTGQFGKNHLGDSNQFLPTAHGFDEFFGNLYHLNAEEEPEDPEYPKDPGFAEQFGPRGVIHSWATEEEDPTVHPKFGPGRQADDRGHRPADEEANGDDRRRGQRCRRGVHPPGRRRRQAVLRLVEHDPHAHLDAPRARGAGRHRDRHLPRRHGRARRRRGPACSICSTSSG